MRYRKTYLNLFTPLILFGIYLTVRLFGQLVQEQRQELTMYLLTADLSSGEIPLEVLENIQEFPGFCRMWTGLTIDVEIFAGDYQYSGKVTGVDLQTYPLKLIKSAGEKSVGTKPLLVIGEDLLKGMTDFHGKSMTDRQLRRFWEDLGSQKAELRLSEGKGDGDALELTEEAEFLGIAGDSKIYMDASLMETWLHARGIQPKMTWVCMEIQGKSHVTAAKKSMEAAGFSSVNAQKTK